MRSPPHSRAEAQTIFMAAANSRNERTPYCSFRPGWGRSRDRLLLRRQDQFAGLRVPLSRRLRGGTVADYQARIDTGNLPRSSRDQITPVRIL